jgi:hypothetical protein
VTSQMHIHFKNIFATIHIYTCKYRYIFMEEIDEQKDIELIEELFYESYDVMLE